MRTIRLIAACVVLLCGAPAQAQETAESCASSFPERLADAQRAVLAHHEFTATRDRVMPWFDRHCRLLDRIERIARHIDDEWAFVCDTRRGRPRQLNERFVERYGGGVTISDFMRLWARTRLCSEHDARERLPLRRMVSNGGGTQQMIIMCFESEEPLCAARRQEIDDALRQLRGQNAEPEPEGAPAPERPPAPE